MRRTRRDPSTEDAQTVERVRTTLEAHLADGGPESAVRIAYVLDLLKPRGLWQFDPERRRPATPEPDPHRDPLTGARWAGPPGSAPPA